MAVSMLWKSVFIITLKICLNLTLPTNSFEEALFIIGFLILTALLTTMGVLSFAVEAGRAAMWTPNRCKAPP